MIIPKLSKSFYALVATLAIVVAVGIPLGTMAAYETQTVYFDPGYAFEQGSGLGDADPVDVTAGIINIALGVLALVAVALLIYAGFVWILSRGNEEEVTKAKGIVYGVVFGLVIIFISYSLTQFVFNNLLEVTNAS